jgi:hypothetical protein
MFSSNMLIVGAVLLSLSGCATVDCEKNTTGKVLAGTSTALVGLYLDDKGYPQASVNTVIISPGQRIVFSGPKEFDIFFKDKKSPVEQFELSARDSVLTLDIPEDVFAQEGRDDPSSQDNKELSYKYGIRVNGKETDPEIRVIPR